MLRMSRTDDAPQSVGTALNEGWNWLGVECGHCGGRGHRIDLRHRQPTELLAKVAGLVRCTTCPADVGRDYLNFKLIAVWTSEREKHIGFSGIKTVKIGMT
jgi:hypothetical protein